MKALLIKEKGEFPRIVDYKLPLEKGKVRVKMIASALNHRDLWIIKGQYAGLKYPIIPGSDGTGILDGRRVIINPSHNWGNDQDYQGENYKILGLPDHGTMAEYCQVYPNFIYDTPDFMTDTEAAALPLAGLTAYRALFVQGGGKHGMKVLVSGIGGGVALFALQFALAAGMQTFVTSGSDEKIEKAIALGATAGYNYKDPEWARKLTTQHGTIDLVIDGAAGDGFSNFPKILRSGGVIVNYGGTMGKINGLIPQILFWKQLTIKGSTMGSDSDFENMLHFVTKHRINPIIDSCMDLEDSHMAFNRMDSGEQFGKIVLLH